MNVAFLILSIASLLVSIVATFIAKKSLSDTERIAERDRNEWKQRQWFDLYFKASQLCNSLEHFQTRHRAKKAEEWHSLANEYNELILLARHLAALAFAFPKNSVIDALLKATEIGGMNVVFNPDRLKAMQDAVEGLRLRALVDASVLE